MADVITSGEVAGLDATDQRRLVREGHVTPQGLVEAAIARIERLNPSLNAVIHERFERALEEASSPDLPDGPFRGVPMVVKDLVSHTAGDPFHCGMRFLRDRAWTERSDSYVAAKLRGAGFVFVGRTNTPELGLMPTTEPEAYGPTHNPWHPDHSPGGSSGGTGAAVASGMVALGHATDGGGSIRIPASECGLVGLKPSRGRISDGGDATGSMFGFSVEHCLTRTVRDTAAVLDVLADRAPERPFAEEVGAEPGRLRIAVTARSPGGLIPVHDDCLAAAEETGRLLESLGHDVTDGYPRELDEVEHVVHFGAAIGRDAASLLDHWSARTGHRIEPGDVEANTWWTAEIGRAITDETLASTTEWLRGYARRMIAWWDEFDLLVTPTLSEPPPRLGEFASTPDNPLAPGWRGGLLTPFTLPWNSTGQPAISLPLHWNASGLPVGVQLVAGPGREDVLVRVAAQLEQARPWSDRRAPVFG